ncbi:MAG: 2-dehydro-3-deoxygalactonokinase [Rhodospirillaceae bacterium]|nr:2-dehydro-3-deoxygalactonokinase [Rhodospirillaceae bacterium]
MSGKIACIALDWGTSNRRGWALDAGGHVVDARSDDQGLIAVTDRDFAGSLRRFVADWLGGRPPVIMAGMIGSRLGWREAAYLETPVDLTQLGLHLTVIEDFDDVPVRIVPGVARVTEDSADVMRGEECQMLGALLARGQRDGVFLLPGTHAKWALLENGILTDFRTYMTGELFGHLRNSGSLSQVMPPMDAPETFDADAFDRGVTRAGAPDAPGITHLLFGVRSLSLFSKLTPATAPSYLSGLLVGAEMRDALRWTPARQVTAIGSAKLLETYARAAAYFKITLDRLESDDILPPALFGIAREAGLVAKTAA